MDRNEGSLEYPESRLGGSGSLNAKDGLGGVLIGGPPALGCGFGVNVRTGSVGAEKLGVLVVSDDADGVANEKEGELDRTEAEFADKDGELIDGVEKLGELGGLGVLNFMILSPLQIVPFIPVGQR